MITTLKHYLEQNPFVADNIKYAGIIVLTIIVYYITKYLLFNVLSKIISKTKTKADDILLNKKILRKVSYIPSLLILQQFKFFNSPIENYLDKFLQAIIFIVFVQIITSLLDAAVELLGTFKKFKNRPIKSYAQVVKIIIWIIGIIFLFGIVTGQSFWSLFAGLGAMSAVLLLIFKDTILSFVASIQIASYDLVKVGDWIEIPNYNVDGDVMDISLHTIKIRNFDKTITVVPTKAILDTSLKNWRGMQEAGGRRIKRSIFIDLASVKFCDKEMLARLQKIALLKDYLSSKINEVDSYNNKMDLDFSLTPNGRRLTNLGTFRAYLKSYLHSREDIHDGLTFLVRQLAPGTNGLPIEIYVFATTTEWVKYEEIQADIFDHIFAVIKEFNLNIFQNPAGTDIEKLNLK